MLEKTEEEEEEEQGREHNVLHRVLQYRYIIHDDVDRSMCASVRALNILFGVSVMCAGYYV